MGQFFEVNALEFTIQPFIRLLWQIADEERFERVEAKIRDGLGGRVLGKLLHIQPHSGVGEVPLSKAVSSLE